MKIDELPISESLSKNDIEVVQKKQHEYHLVGRTRLIPGHKMFSYNRVTGEIKEAEKNSYAMMNFDKTVSLKNEIKIEKDCFYDQALNQKNFIKRLKRYGVMR